MATDDPCGSPQHLPVNMFEASEAVVVVAPMAAVQPDDVRVTVEGRTLTISADCRTEARKDYLVHEWHYGPYERTIELPAGFGGGGEGTLGNGQLALRILKGSGGGTVIVPVVKP